MSELQAQNEDADGQSLLTNGLGHISALRVDLYDCMDKPLLDYMRPVIPVNMTRSAWITQTLGEQIWVLYEFRSEADRIAWEAALPDDVARWLDRTLLPHALDYGWQTRDESKQAQRPPLSAGLDAGRLRCCSFCGGRLENAQTENNAAGGLSDLTAVLCRLRDLGCFPCLSYRGNGIWRAHVNGAGNFWADARSPDEAMASAEREWERAGKPMDGYAA